MAAGDLLLEPPRAKVSRTIELQEVVKEVLGDGATIQHELVLKVKDLDMLHQAGHFSSPTERVLKKEQDSDETTIKTIMGKTYEET